MNIQDMSVLFSVMFQLKQIEWFTKSVIDIRGYKIEDWSDFTKLIRE